MCVCVCVSACLCAYGAVCVCVCVCIVFGPYIRYIAYHGGTPRKNMSTVMNVCAVECPHNNTQRALAQTRARARRGNIIHLIHMHTRAQCVAHVRPPYVRHVRPPYTFGRRACKTQKPHHQQQHKQTRFRVHNQIKTKHMSPTQKKSVYINTHTHTHTPVPSQPTRQRAVGIHHRQQQPPPRTNTPVS